MGKKERKEKSEIAWNCIGAINPEVSLIRSTNTQKITTENRKEEKKEKEKRMRDKDEDNAIILSD
jgi:hypothetical protein